MNFQSLPGELLTHRRPNVQPVTLIGFVSPECRSSTPCAAAITSRCQAPLFTAGRFCFVAESRWGLAKFALERAIKSRLGFIAHFRRDLRNAIARGIEHLRAELQPPAGEVSHRRLTQKMAEALRQHRSGNP